MRRKKKERQHLGTIHLAIRKGQPAAVLTLQKSCKGFRLKEFDFPDAEEKIRASLRKGQLKVRFPLDSINVVFRHLMVDFGDEKGYQELSPLQFSIESTFKVIYRVDSAYYRSFQKAAELFCRDGEKLTEYKPDSFRLSDGWVFFEDVLLDKSGLMEDMYVCSFMEDDQFRVLMSQPGKIAEMISIAYRAFRLMIDEDVIDGFRMVRRIGEEVRIRGQEKALEIMELALKKNGKCLSDIPDLPSEGKERINAIGKFLETAADYFAFGTAFLKIPEDYSEKIRKAVHTSHFLRNGGNICEYTNKAGIDRYEFDYISYRIGCPYPYDTKNLYVKELMARAAAELIGREYRLTTDMWID